MYKIGNVNIRVNGLHEENISSRLELFYECGINSKLDATYQVQYVRSLHSLESYPQIYTNGQFAVRQKDSCKLYCYLMDELVYAVLEEKEDKYQLYLNEEFFKGSIHPYFFPSLLGLERLLIKKSSFVLHSSYISVEGGAILFTAPSGGGKSTQADLWNHYAHAEIINGDKSIVGKENGEWFAYGIPFSGSSKHCRNERYPLRAIIILEKGNENFLTDVGISGFSKIFSQITVNPWDKEFCEEAMDLTMNVCKEVPVYYYVCRKDESAVDILYQELVRRGVLYGAFE